MKKIICILLIAAMAVIGFTGCTSDRKELDRFVELPYGESIATYAVKYCVDRETNVIYVVRGQGGISPLYNADGTPMLYDEFMESMEEE